MSFIKKKRNKLKYKKILKLKLDIKNPQKIINFRKKKWQSLIKILKRRQKNKTSVCKIYDNARYFLPVFCDSFKRKFRNSLHVRYKICLLYGIFLKKDLRISLKRGIKRAQLDNQFLNLQSFLIEEFENRIYRVLSKAHFVESSKEGQQLIKHKQVLVNNKIVTWKKQKLKKGDVLELLERNHKKISLNVYKSEFDLYTPKYLQINYKTLQIRVVRDIKETNTSLNRPLGLI